MRLTGEFFARDPREVAQDLLGRELVRAVSTRRIYRRGIITETGAYHGYIEGRKREGLAYVPGVIFLYFGPRGYPVFCIVTESEGVPSVVSIRELYPLEGIDMPVDGPAKLVRALRTDGSFDGRSINGNNLWIEGISLDSSKIQFISQRQRKMVPNCLGYYRM